MTTEQERLEAFERLLADTRAQLEDADAQLAELKAAGKVKTVTYRELFGRKTMLKTMIATFDRYGLL